MHREFGEGFVSESHDSFSGFKLCFVLLPSLGCLDGTNFKTVFRVFNLNWQDEREVVQSSGI